MVNLVFLLGVFFVIRFQPLFIVRRLILIRLLYSFLIYKVIGTFWFRYILLIVMIRGVLVVFTYIVRLIPNESFEIYGLIIFFSFILIILVGLDFFFFKDIRIIRINLWMTFLSILNLILISFLLVIILLVVYITYIEEGAFRV